MLNLEFEDEDSRCEASVSRSEVFLQAVITLPEGLRRPAILCNTRRERFISKPSIVRG